ncbi:MAG: hypothetical protein R2911_30320 [Caldilineaceae bacterium]
MQFMRRVREGIRRGEITTTIRIWQTPHVKIGGCYKLGNGEVVVESLMPNARSDITSTMVAYESGFDGLIDLLKTAKHGPGTNVYFTQFRYQECSGD